MSASRDLMTAIGSTTVVRILGAYETLLDERHDLEIEALANPERATEHYRALGDVDRRLFLYAQLAAEAGRLISDKKAQP